jgi:hypothetical protein
MKLLLILLPIFLLGCLKPSTNSTTPSENSEFTIESSSKSVDENEELILRFNSTEEREKFTTFLNQKARDEFIMETTAIDNTTVITVSANSPTLLTLENSSWSESDIIPELAFSPTASITIGSSFYGVSSPFTSLLLPPLYDKNKHESSQLLPNIINLNNSTGSVNSLEIMEEWNEFAAKNPASFRAIVGDVVGLKELVTGEESRLSGLSPRSQLEIQINTVNGKDINNRKLLSTLTGTGNRYQANILNRSRVYTYSDSSIQTPHLKSINFIKTNDPIISFSTKKSDGLLLHRTEDIQLIRNRFKSSLLKKVDEQTIFLSLNSSLTKEERLNIIGKIDSKTILNQVPVDGRITDKLEKSSKSPYIITPLISEPLPTPLKIIYSPRSPVAKQSAKALLNTLLDLKFEAFIEEDFEKSLYLNNYHIAVGAINSSILDREEGRDFIADLYFNGEKSEEERLYSGVEKPLFSLPIYLVLRKPYIIPNGDINLICKKK